MQDLTVYLHPVTELEAGEGVIEILSTSVGYFRILAHTLFKRSGNKCVKCSSALGAAWCLQQGWYCKAFW